MKINRYGQARILTDEDLDRLFAALPTLRDHTLFALCRYTGCRINEACSVRTDDIYNETGVRSRITLRKQSTKGKRKTRSIPTKLELAALLEAHRSQAGKVYVFPGRHSRGHIHPDSASAILRQTLEGLGIEGASTHSFRRTTLTQLQNLGTPLRVIQEISGHESLAALEKYLEVSAEQLEDAIANL